MEDAHGRALQRELYPKNPPNTCKRGADHVLGIERLIFARPNFQRWKSDTIVVGKNKMAVGNLIAVTANDKGSVLLAIAGQSRHSLELARIG